MASYARNSAYRGRLTPELTHSYLQEIERLKVALDSKNAELNSMRASMPAAVVQGGVVSPPTPYLAKISKVEYDRQQSEYKRREEAEFLNQQLRDKDMQKDLEKRRQESELARRLEDLNRLREEELKRQNERLQKARSYKNDLDVQSRLVERIRLEENLYRRKEAPWVPGSGGEGTPEPIKLPPPKRISNKFQHNASAFYETEDNSIPVTRFYKQRQRNLSYNPITGEFRDTSKISYLPPPPRKLNPFYPEKKNQARISAEFAPLPAFQHPKFTRTNPKVTASFPVTGDAQINPTVLSDEFKKDTGNFFGV